jgi:hypothetical protein
MTIKYASMGSQVGSALLDTVSSANTLLHEHWHESHIKAANTKTTGKFQTWWNGYTGNKFGDNPSADSAGKNDRTNGHVNAYGDAISLCLRSAAHEGLNEPDLYTVTSNGIDYWRSHNADWGQPLLDTINLHTIQFQKIAGNCEN